MWNTLFVYFRMLSASIAKDEKGQTLVEYGLIIGLVSVALITALGLLTGALQTVFTDIDTALGKA